MCSSNLEQLHGELKPLERPSKSVDAKSGIQQTAEIEGKGRLLCSCNTEREGMCSEPGRAGQALTV